VFVFVAKPKKFKILVDRLADTKGFQCSPLIASIQQQVRKYA
jgi:hypothetical protein